MTGPREFLGESPTNAQVRKLLVSCTQTIGVDGAGISLRRGAAQEPLLGTDAIADALEQAQFTVGEGPCVDASSFGVPVLLDDIEVLGAGHVGRWPVFVNEAIGLGVRAIFALPLLVGAVPIGAADLYRRTPGPLEGGDLTRALTAMDDVALAVIDPYGTGASEDEKYGTSLRNVEVHQAAGMVMVQLDISIEQAIVRLRATAFAEGVPVEKVAADVIRRRRRFEGRQR